MRGACDYAFCIDVNMPSLTCGGHPLELTGDASLEYFVEPADADSGFPRQTYDVWLTDLTIALVTCPDCARHLTVDATDLASLRARAAMELMTTHRSALEAACEEDHGS
jgi:hypothetical protein